MISDCGTAGLMKEDGMGLEGSGEKDTTIEGGPRWTRISEDMWMICREG